MSDMSPSIADLLTAWARRIKEVAMLCDEFPCPYGYDDFEPGCDCFRCKVHRAAARGQDDQPAEVCGHPAYGIEVCERCMGQSVAEMGPPGVRGSGHAFLAECAHGNRGYCPTCGEGDRG